MLNFLYRTEDIIIVFVYCHVQSILTAVLRKQESPDDADKPTRKHAENWANSTWEQVADKLMTCLK